jgi:glycosyltransferase involved in cell wall biosynthesis
LDCIVSQFKDKELYNQVEIVISDNASKDNTEELVKKYQKDFSNIRYFRNLRNLGYDRNVNNVITKATGDFCWTLSDDEFIKKDTLKFVLNIIKNNLDISHICIDSNNILNGNEIRYFKDGNDWLLKMGVAGGLVSQNIFNKKYLPSNREKYYDNLWIHLSLVLEVIAHRPSVLIKNIFRPTNHPCGSGWEHGDSFFTYIYLKKIIQDLHKFGYDQEIIDKLVNDFAKGLPRDIASAKIHGLKRSFANLKLLIKEFFHFPILLFISVLVFLTPVTILKKIKNFKNR